MPISSRLIAIFFSRPNLLNITSFQAFWVITWSWESHICGRLATREIWQEACMAGILIGLADLLIREDWIMWCGLLYEEGWETCSNVRLMTWLGIHMCFEAGRFGQWRERLGMCFRVIKTCMAGNIYDLEHASWRDVIWLSRCEWLGSSCGLGRWCGIPRNYHFKN